MGEHQVIFNGLGPNGRFYHEGKAYKDGDVATVNDSIYVILLKDLHYAVDATDTNVDKIQRLVKSAEQKRITVAEKMAIKQKGGK